MSCDVFFFFKQKTAYEMRISDWSSDVCSSDLEGLEADLAIAVYARQGEGRELVGFGQGAVAPGREWAWSASAPAPAHAHGEHIVDPGPVTRAVVSFYNICGERQRVE